MKNALRKITIGYVLFITAFLPFSMNGQHSFMVSGNGQLRMLPNTADNNVGMTYYNFLPQYKPLTKSITITRYNLYYNDDLGEYTRCKSRYIGSCDDECCSTTIVLYDEQGRISKVSNCSFQYEDDRIIEYQIKDGSKCRFKYDSQNRLESATQAKWTYNYSLAKNGNITKVNEFFGAESRGTTSGFQYDSNHRIIAYKDNYSDYSWVYDTKGDLISYRKIGYSFSKGREGGKTSDHEYQFEYGEDGNPIRCIDYIHGDITVIDGMFEYEYKYTYYLSREELEKLELNYKEAFDMDVVDVKPSYPEGKKELFLIGILQNAKGIDPTIVDYIVENNEMVVCFIVEPDGNVSNLKVLTEDGFVIDEEITQAISSLPKWEPGWVGGEKVRVIVKLSLELHINR